MFTLKFSYNLFVNVTNSRNNFKSDFWKMSRSQSKASDPESNMLRGRNSGVQLLLMTVGAFVVVRIMIISLTVNRLTEEVDFISVPSIAEFHHLKEGLVPYVSFEPGYPKKVVVLTYQRCGSSFFGQLFNTNPEVFYMYEPLDSVYTALYGTKEGWNVPSDITSYWDGTERLVPEREKKAVAQFLKHLLSCNMDALPTETLIHKYWFQFAGDHAALNNYIRCLRDHNIHQTNCSMYTPKYCGSRFGEFPQDRMDECNQRLWNDSYTDGPVPNRIAKNFTAYKECMSGLRKFTEEVCVDRFQDVCDRSRLRSAKTVRGTMGSMEYLLASVPNFRVIHLIRDPRAVVLSRLEFDNSARGKYSLGDMVKEAKLYCRTVARDVRMRRVLERKFPGKIINIVYEDLVQEPLRYTEKIYAFLNTTLPEKTMKWVLDHTSKIKDSSFIAQKWVDKLSYRKTNEITAQCLEFFREIRYPWFGVP